MRNRAADAAGPGEVPAPRSADAAQRRPWVLIEDACSRRLTARWPVVALLAVFALDGLRAARDWPLTVAGLLDEPAHLLTAWLVLSVLPDGRWRALRPWALAGAVLIDVDHVPLYLWGALVGADGGRPVTHSLVAVLVLAVLGAAVRPVRTMAWGLGLGFLLHFLRDVASSPGVPLLWPVDDVGVRIPYGLFAVVMVLVTAVSVARSRRGRVGHGGPDGVQRAASRSVVQSPPPPV